MFLNRISASKRDVIDLCLLKYRYKYIDKYPGFGAENQDSLSFGSFTHKVLELGYKLTRFDELLKLAHENRKQYDIPNEVEDKIKICLQNFLRWNSGLGETVSTEAPFEVFLDEKNDIKFNGVIDRIVKGSKGGYLVIDYKTSKREKTKSELLNDNQLLGYAFAVNELYKIPYNEIYCCHFYPVTGNFVVVKFSAFQVANWKKKMIDTVWRIRKKTLTEENFPAQKNMFCNWCEMKPICIKFNTPEAVCKGLSEQQELKAKLAKIKEDASNKPVDSVKGKDTDNKSPNLG